MINSEAWKRVENEIEAGQRFVLTTHVHPDGDGLGCEIALAELLLSKGKAVQIVNCSPLPEKYEFIDPKGLVEHFAKESDSSAIMQADVHFILDISDWARLRAVGEELKQRPGKRICIDHHPRTDDLADIFLIDERAAATAEILFELTSRMGVSMTYEMALPLYVGILTDTGSFRFSNTRAESHRMVGELVACGVKPNEVYRDVYENIPRERIKLLGLVYESIEYLCQGRLAWFAVTQEMLAQAGASTDDSGGMSEIPRSIEGVEVSVMFQEMDSNRTKVSLRSTGKRVINGVAKKFGGGGHRFAAGVVVDGPLASVRDSVLSEVSELFV